MPGRDLEGGGGTVCSAFGKMKPRSEKIQMSAYLHGVKPGVDASYTFHSDDRSPMQGAQGYQTRHDMYVFVWETQRKPSEVM